MVEKLSVTEAALAEHRALGRELARRFNQLTGGNEELEKLLSDEIQDRLRELLSVRTVEDVLEKDLDDISWLDLSCLADDGQASEAWERIKQASREEELMGITAAKTLEGVTSSPLQRAQFFAIRSGLIDEWRPRGGMEEQLIDIVAMSIYTYRHWIQVHVFRSTTRVEIQKGQVTRNGKRIPDFSYEMEDTERAAEMADRFLRMALRTLRALRDLRRFSPSVSIQNAGQVNIGEKQVNVGRADPGTCP